MIKPNGQQISNFISRSDANEGVVHAINLKGGFQELPQISDMTGIPVFADNGNDYGGFSDSQHEWSSGMRSVGMVVQVLDSGDGTPKTYTLIPEGFFGNGGTQGVTEWLALDDAEKAVYIYPQGTFTVQKATPGNGFTLITTDAATLGISAEPLSCWVEYKAEQSGPAGPEGPIGPKGEDGDTSIVKNFTITVDNPGVGNRYYIDGVQQDTITLLRGFTYTFDQADASNGTINSTVHPFQLSTVADGVHNGGMQYTSGWSQSGNIGVDLVWTFKVPNDAPSTLWYYCHYHSGMGGSIEVETLAAGADGAAGAQGEPGA